MFHASSAAYCFVDFVHCSYLTRGSFAAEGPRDALNQCWNLVNCRTTVRQTTHRKRLHLEGHSRSLKVIANDAIRQAISATS